MIEAEKSKVVKEVFKEKEEWLDRSVRRLYDVGYTLDDISYILGVNKTTLRSVFRYHLNIELK